MNRSIWLMPVAYLLVSGCASVLDGSHQRLSIETRYKDTQIVGATCTVNNDKGMWTVTTPGSLIVNRSFGDLSAKCEKEGFAAGSLALRSASKDLAFIYMLVGGVIGTIVDIATGAAYDYPSSMIVEMGDPAFSLVSTPGSSISLEVQHRYLSAAVGSRSVSDQHGPAKKMSSGKSQVRLMGVEREQSGQAHQ